MSSLVFAKFRSSVFEPHLENEQNRLIVIHTLMKQPSGLIKVRPGPGYSS